MVKELLKYAVKDKQKMIITLISVVGIAGIDLVLPLFSKQVISVYIPAKDVTAVVQLMFVFIGLIVLYTLLNFVQGYYGHLWGLRIHQTMREEALQKLQRLPFSYFDRNKSGIIQTRIGPDLVNISEMIHHFTEDMLSVLLITVVGYIYLAQTNSMITFIIFLIIVLQVSAGLVARKRMEKGFSYAREATSEVYSVIDTNITGVRLTRAFANESFERNRFLYAAQNQAKGIQKAYRGLGIFMATNNFFTMTLNICVVGLTGIAVAQGTLDFSEMMVFVVYFNLLLAPVRTIIRSFEMLQEGIVGFRRYQVLMEEVEEHHPAQGKVIETLEGDIRFDHVVFHYDKENEPVLKHLNLHIQAGTMVALVGPSGVGKSTIVQLIPRFYEIDKGNIYIDGLDIQSYDLFSLRKQIGFVQQDVYIFWGTLEDNIRYGKLDATYEEIVEAAKQAGIHDFIIQLEKGYDTEVGERGVKLSGGQKQRISLARIFLKNPKILILDEATSALDNVTEAIIQENIEKLTYNRTVIVVAHRLSTIKNADAIVVLDEEGVIEYGTHTELLNEQGKYAQLYQSQFQSDDLLEYEEKVTK